MFSFIKWAKADYLKSALNIDPYRKLHPFSLTWVIYRSYKLLICIYHLWSRLRRWYPLIICFNNCIVTQWYSQTKVIKKTNVFDEILCRNKANLNAAMITLLKVNLAHLQIVITFYGHTLAGGYFICHRDIMVHPDCSFVSAEQWNKQINQINNQNKPNKQTKKTDRTN